MLHSLLSALRQPHSLSRRSFLQLGGAGLTLSSFLNLRSALADSSEPKSSSAGARGKAKSCIVLFAWGGMSHLDTWDLKPTAGDDIRGEFRPISTRVPGIQISEHLPRLAQQTDRLAIVRSVHHKASDHREAAYWNLTGHEPKQLGVPAVPPSAEDWPSLAAVVAKVRGEQDREAHRALALPGAITLPYPCADRGLLNGQYAGFLGLRYEPTFVHPGAGTPYKGQSPQTSTLQVTQPADVDAHRLTGRRELLSAFEDHSSNHADFRDAAAGISQFNQQALELLLDPQARAALDVKQESEQTRAAYGDHVCGQSVLLARRLTEAGVPLVTVNCGSGDLFGGQGDHWDTHGDNFNRLKRDLLPPLDQASAALLDDLAARGRLDDTLVVWMTEFGRTPQITGGGRNHFPNCYSVAFAGGGVQGGQVYGRSDKTGSAPAENACGPEDLQATILHALGIDLAWQIRDLTGRPHPICGGHPLPIV